MRTRASIPEQPARRRLSPWEWLASRALPGTLAFLALLILLRLSGQITNLWLPYLVYLSLAVSIHWVAWFVADGRRPLLRISCTAGMYGGSPWGVLWVLWLLGLLYSRLLSDGPMVGPSSTLSYLWLCLLLILHQLRPPVVLILGPSDSSPELRREVARSIPPLRYVDILRPPGLTKWVFRAQDCVRSHGAWESKVEAAAAAARILLLDFRDLTEHTMLEARIVYGSELYENSIAIVDQPRRIPPAIASIASGCAHSPLFIGFAELPPLLEEALRSIRSEPERSLVDALKPSPG